ncbi:hypothetical protein C882_2998 [Caenispirillum salinarum AK4]|uniref:Uncharacterized protein n=1 Tax=Caenispirillum salinarum AK4 TaxID=1238182 RepID=K9H4C1_9PROT|nr:hypothetical protein [Caenispirillum salinarum]EKV31934.1 hypothetical protein C882_2998 [Caenispirillum salinarum AK4]
MRFLPILLPVFMLAPILIWMGLEMFVIKGDAARWLSGNLWEVGLGLAVTFAACIAVAKFVADSITKTMRHH